MEQYTAFFEANAPYSVTGYSFPSVQRLGDSVTVKAAFIVTSASGVEQLQRTQQLVRENGSWRVVMSSEQLAAFAATDDEANTGPAGKEAAPAEEKASTKSGQKRRRPLPQSKRRARPP